VATKRRAEIMKGRRSVDPELLLTMAPFGIPFIPAAVFLLLAGYTACCRSVLKESGALMVAVKCNLSTDVFP
jgi:hypothetical protein